MASDVHSQAKERRSRRPPVAGIVVLLVVGGAVALPLMMDSGCSPTRAGVGSATEPMELWGRWLGMMLASADSGTARNLGIPAMVAGVVVAEVSNDPRSRVAQVGLMPGDVIVKVDGTSTQNLAELYTLTTRLSVARPLPIEVMRQGQTMMVVLPPPMEAATQPPMTLAQPGAAPATPQAQTQAAWNSGRALPQSMPAQAATPAAPPQQNAATWPVMPAPAAPNTVMGP